MTLYASVFRAQLPSASVAMLSVVCRRSLLLPVVVVAGFSLLAFRAPPRTWLPVISLNSLGVSTAPLAPGA